MSSSDTPPENFVNEVPIEDRQQVIDLLRGHPCKNTKEFLVIEDDVAWVQVEIYGREMNLHLSTDHHLIALNLARSLIEEGVVVKKWHPPEYGGERLELNRT